MIRRTAAVLAVAVTVASAACGGRDGDNDGTSRAAGSNAVRPTATTATGADNPSPTATTPAPATNLATTGTTAAAIAGFKLSFPKRGAYKFRETIVYNGGGDPVDRDTFFQVSSPSASVVRLQETSASGAPKSDAYYDERHDADGLWLVASATSGGVCDWQPKSASLPQSVIDGGTVTTDATCATGGSVLRLQTTVAFKAVRDATVAGRVMRVIDVTRRRVLSESDTTITSDVVDTYSFALGLRIAASERTSTNDSRGTRVFTRNLVLLSVPS